MHLLTIPGRLPGMNEYTAACRTNPYVGAVMKRDAQRQVEVEIMGARAKGELPRQLIEPVRLVYMYYERDKRRDQDNISSFAHKVIQDALVSMGLLRNDGWSNISGWADGFRVDRERPRIEVMIEEG